MLRRPFPHSAKRKKTRLKFTTHLDCVGTTHCKASVETLQLSEPPENNPAGSDPPKIDLVPA